MRTVTLLIVAGCSLAVGRLLAKPAATQPAVEMSPHAEALRLVFAKCGDRIRAVDQEKHWWFDTKARNWSVERPFEPGAIDSTHMFRVGYQIDGKAAAVWFVDTRRGTAEEAGLPATRPGK